MGVIVRFRGLDAGFVVCRWYCRPTAVFGTFCWGRGEVWDRDRKEKWHSETKYKAREAYRNTNSK